MALQLEYAILKDIMEMTFDDIYREKDSKRDKKAELGQFGEVLRFHALNNLFLYQQDCLEYKLAEETLQAMKDLKHPGYLGDARRDARERPTDEEHRQGKTLCPTIFEKKKWACGNMFHRAIHDPAYNVLVVKEKHDTYYHDIAKAEDAANAFLSIIDTRLKDGYWYDDDVPEDEAKEWEEPDMFNHISDQPKSSKQEAEEIIAYARIGKPNAFIRAGKWAYGFLQDRTEHQYEGIEVEKATKASFG